MIRVETKNNKCKTNFWQILSTQPVLVEFIDFILEKMFLKNNINLTSTGGIQLKLIFKAKINIQISNWINNKFWNLKVKILCLSTSISIKTKN